MLAPLGRPGARRTRLCVWSGTSPRRMSCGEAPCCGLPPCAGLLGVLSSVVVVALVVPVVPGLLRPGLALRGRRVGALVIRPLALLVLVLALPLALVTLNPCATDGSGVREGRRTKAAAPRRPWRGWRPPWRVAGRRRWSRMTSADVSAKERRPLRMPRAMRLELVGAVAGFGDVPLHVGLHRILRPQPHQDPRPFGGVGRPQWR